MKINKNVFIIFGVIFVLAMLTSRSLAASISISSSKTVVNPGEIFTVSVTGNDATGKVNISGGTVTPSSKWIENNSVDFSVTAPQTGSVTITASGEFSDSQGIDFEDSKSVTITVSEPAPVTPSPEPTTPTEPSTPSEPEKPAEPVVSSNANLSNLGIKPKEYDFKGFRASKTSYEVTVPNDVTQIEVYASKQDSKATIEGLGKKNLQEGTNVFKIVVKAEDGTTKTYKLNVIRQVASTEITPNTSEEAEANGEENTIGLLKLEVKGFTLSTEFEPNVYRYTVQLENEEQLSLEQVKKLIETEVNFEGGTFEITGEEKLDKEENEVIISVKDADGREIAIYTLVFKYPPVADTAETTGIVNDVVANKDDEIRSNTIDKEQLIVIFSITIILLIAIKSSITSYRQRRILKENGLLKQKKVYDEKEEEIVEENINQNFENGENEEKQDYIEDLFRTSQNEFSPEDKDFSKRKRGKGKHS